MKKLAMLAAAATFAVAGSVGTAQGAIVYLSTDGTADSGGIATTPVANPTITVPVGSSGTLYFLGKRSGGTGSVNGLGLSLAQGSGDTGKITATSFNIFNPSSVINTDDGPATITRWQATNNGTLNTAGNLVTDSVATAVTNPNGFFQSLNSNLRVYAAFDYTATQVGTVNLFLKVGEGRIAETSGFATSTFGLAAVGPANDPTVVDNTIAGASSAIPDAIITVTPVPEPASISLLGLGAMGLLARRRRA